DEPGDALRRLLVEAQRPHPPGGELGADDVVVVEGDTAPGLEAPGAWLADVVEERGEPEDEVGPGDGMGLLPVTPVRAGRALQVDRLLQHGEGVLVDVLVPVVLVDLETKGGQLRQHLAGQARLDEEAQAGDRVVTEDELDELVADPFGGDGVSPSWATKRAARIIRSGSSLKETSGADGVRSRCAARSSIPPWGSTSSRPGRRSAIALTVKSRLTRSSSRSSPKATTGLR